MYRGITIGYNDAFIIDASVRAKLIEDDPQSVEIIKPVLKGAHILRYETNYKDLYIIATFPAKKVNIDDYPAVKKYLKSFGKRLHQIGEPGTRKKTNNKWFETQDQINYHQDFQKEKIIYSEIVQAPQFYLDIEKHYIEATSFLITGDHIRYLIVFLNSPIVASLFKLFYAGGGLGEKGYRYKKAFLENLPIPHPSLLSSSMVSEISTLASRMQASAGADTEADRRIDALVQEAYGLTDAEVQRLLR